MGARKPRPLGTASPSQRAKFHLVFTRVFAGPSTRAGSSAHAFINFLLVLPGAPALLSVFTWKISGLPMRDLALEG